jgi:hypothetical protein
MAMRPRETSDVLTSGNMRVVIGGFRDADSLSTAHAELAAHGFRQDQLCVLCPSGTVLESFPEKAHLSFDPRDVGEFVVGVSSAGLFDAIGLADAATVNRGSHWMPTQQAMALWTHIRDGWPALLANACTPDQQIDCSRVQLLHRPSFLHLFNFTL